MNTERIHFSLQPIVSPFISLSPLTTNLPKCKSPRRKRDDEDFAKQQEEIKQAKAQKLIDDQKALEKANKERQEREARERLEAIAGKTATGGKDGAGGRDGAADKEAEDDKKPKRSQAELNALIQKIPEGDDVFR